MLTRDSEEFNKLVEVVWQLQIEFVTDFDELLEEAAERSGLRITRRDLQQVLKELENRVECLDDDGDVIEDDEYDDADDDEE